MSFTIWWRSVDMYNDGSLKQTQGVVWTDTRDGIWTSCWRPADSLVINEKKTTELELYMNGSRGEKDKKK